MLVHLDAVENYLGGDKYHKPRYAGSNTTHHSQVNSKRKGNYYRTYNRTILPTPSQDQQERYPRQNHPISFIC
jgi:hypothetical protein